MNVSIAEPTRRITSPHVGEKRILVPNVPWRLYELFAELLPESTPVRIAFDGRNMEIMVTGPAHDQFNWRLGLFVMTVAAALRVKILPQGETTWIRPEIARGIEADNCYYLDPVKIAAGKAALRRGSNDVKDYPNPDLVTEVDISPPEADTMAIYAAMRVPEVWRFDAHTLIIERLDDAGHYQVVERSGFFPIRADQIPRWLLDEDFSDFEDWTRRLRAWVRKESRAK
ncbi:MAG: Uma2 family endonuclease [Isosphaeraceae bacterium]